MFYLKNIHGDYLESKTIDGEKKLELLNSQKKSCRKNQKLRWSFKEGRILDEDDLVLTVIRNFTDIIGTQTLITYIYVGNPAPETLYMFVYSIKVYTTPNSTSY